MMEIFFVPLATQSSITGIVNLAGTTTTTKSTGSVISRTEPTTGLPNTSVPANFGLTPINLPSKPASITLLKITEPNLLASAETPTTAIEAGLKNVSKLMDFSFSFTLLNNGRIIQNFTHFVKANLKVFLPNFLLTDTIIIHTLICVLNILKGVKMKEYKVFLYTEGIFSSIFFNGGKVDPVKLTNALNMQAAQGWTVKTMEREKRRTLLFFSREAFVFILEKDA